MEEEPVVPKAKSYLVSFFRPPCTKVLDMLGILNVSSTFGIRNSCVPYADDRTCFCFGNAI